MFLLDQNKEKEQNAIKDILNLFALKKNETIKERITRDISNHFQQEKEDYQKSVRVGNFQSNYYLEYENNGNGNKTLPIKEYLDEMKPYFKDILNNLIKSDKWKTQLTIAINFISFKETGEECVMH